MGTRLSSPAQADPPNQLKTNDLAEVLQLLGRHGYSGVSYYDLGLYLGLNSATLDAIKANERDVLPCLRECLKAWLKRADDVQKKGGPTVFSLVSALRKLGENVAAEEILVMEKHPACKILACYAASNQSLVSALPQMAPLLHLEMHIKETVCVKKEENMLMIEIVKAVCIDSNKLEVFAGILINNKVTVEIGSIIMREYRHCIGSRSSNGNIRPTQDEIYFPPCLTSKFKLMQVQLGSTFDKVESVMIEAQAHSPSKLVKIKNILSYYSQELNPQVAQCDNIHDILKLVRKDCSLDDIEMLKAIVNELDIEEAKVVVQKYSKAIEEFSETELSKCLNERFSYASPLQCERITIVVDQETDDRTLKDVRRLSANIVHKLSPKNSRRIKLNVIREGDSFTITCSFPLILSEQLITAALNNIDVLKENKVKRLTIGYCTVYEVKDTSTATTTEIDEYTSSLSTSSGLSKQLMLSLSVQLINCEEEVTTLNEKNMTIKKEAESIKKEAESSKEEVELLRKEMDIKNKIQKSSFAEMERLRKLAAETSQLLQEKVSHLTEREEENENLKGIKELLEEQLALFQSEKDELDLVEKIEETQLQTVLHQEENEAKSKEEIEMLQMKITTMHSQRMEMDEKVQELMLKIKKLEKALPKDKNYQENDKLNEIKEILEKQLVLFQSENEDGKQLVAVIEKLAETNKAKETNEDTKHEQTTDENERLEKLMFSQNEHLIKREQKLVHLIEEMQNLQAQVEQLTNDEAHSKLEHMEKQNDILLKENEKLSIEVSMLRKQNLRKQKQDSNPIVFQDDIYGEIVIDHPLIIRIVKTRQFQRLKDIKKLGYTYLNIPKASYSRLQHSIGMYYLAKKYVKQLQERYPELITESDVLCVEIAALCYNLGHGPFSHIFEMFLDEIFPNEDKPWESLSEASVMMFDHMIEENYEVKNLLEKYLDEEDIAFIKELIHGTRKGQRKGKEFLYEIVVNKTSGFDVCMIDYTTRDAAVLEMSINFKWMVFLHTVAVKECENGERHIFFQEDDLEIYNDLFRIRQNLFTDLYYFRKNRIITAMIKRILVKSNDTPIIRDGDRQVTLSEAAKNMFVYTQLSDGILNTIKILVNDPEVQVLLKCLDALKFIGQIGYVRPKDDWDTNKIKQHIVQSTKSFDITDQLIMDPIKTGYEDYESLTQYYYTSDGKTGQWTHEWAQQPPSFAAKPPVRIFLVSSDMKIIHEVQQGLKEIKNNVPLTGVIYRDEDNYDLMPNLPLQTTGAIT